MVEIVTQRMEIGGASGGATGIVGCIWTVFTVILVLAAIPVYFLIIPKFVIGGLYVHDCDLQPLLPIFLLVDASVSVFFGQCCQSREQDEDESRTKCEWSIKRTIHSVLFTFQVVWLVFGTIWVLEVRDAKAEPGYCQSNMPLSTPQPTVALLMNMTDMNQTAFGSTTTPDQLTGGSIILSTLASNQPGAGSTTMGAESECEKCHHVLVEFSFVAVIMHWVVVGVSIIVYLLSLVLCVCVCCFGEES